MRTIISYIMQILCKHDFLYEEKWCKFNRTFRSKEGTKISRTCKKCGYHKTYWKF